MPLHSWRRPVGTVSRVTVPRDRRAIAGVVALALALVALIAWWPDAFNRWVIPKDLVLIAAVLVACFAPARGRLPRWFWIIIAAGAGILLLSALLSANPQAAIFGRYPRYEGLVTLPVYVAAAWLGARLLGPDRGSRERTTLVVAASATSTVLAIVGLLEAAGLRPIPTNLERPGALLGTATDQGIIGAALAVLLLPPAAAAWRDRQTPLAVTASIGAASGILSVAFSASRAGALGLVVGVVAVAVLSILLTTGRARRIIAASTAAGLILVGGALLLLPYTRERLLGFDPIAVQTVGDRLFIWTQSLELLGAHPVLGVGPSGFLASYMQAQDAEWFQHIGAQGTLDSPHNVVLQTAMAGGILGVVCAVVFAGFAAVAAGRAIRASRAPELLGAAGAVLAIAAGLLTHFTSPATGILGGLLVGMLVAQAPGTQPRWTAALRTTAMGLWLIAMAAALWGDVQLRAGVDAARASDADAAFSRAVAARPWDVDARSLALQVFAARSDAGDAAAIEPAHTWATASLAVLPDDRAVLLAAGVAARSAGDLDAALAHLSRAAELYPFDPLVLAQYGVTEILAGDEAGRGHLAQAVAIAPDDPTVTALSDWASQFPGP